MTSKYRKYTKLLFAHTSHFTDILHNVRMAEWSKALRSGRSPLLWAWVRIPLLTKPFRFGSVFTESRVAQWKRAGPITQRSVDRNYALLKSFCIVGVILYSYSMSESLVHIGFVKVFL